MSSDVSRSINLNVVLDVILELVNAQIGSIMIVDPSDAILKIIAAVGLEEKIVSKTKIAFGQKIAGKVAVYGKPVFLESTKGFPQAGITSSDMKRSEIKWSFIIPVYHGNHVTGVLNIASLKPNSNHIYLLKGLETNLANVVKRYLVERVFLKQSVIGTNVETLIDPVTGLYTYSHLWTRITEEIGRFSRKKNKFSVLILDIDHFKTINVKHGYTMGDKILQKIGEWLRNNIRVYSVIARTGGDRITILFPETSKEDALSTGKRIKEGIKKIGEELKLDLPLTVSGGVSTFPDDGSSAIEFLEKAYEAMVSAKILGGDLIKTL